MPRYRFELLVGSKDSPTIEKMEWGDADDNHAAKRIAREWASTHPASLTKATRVRVRTEDRAEVWSASITDEFDA